MGPVDLPGGGSAAAATGAAGRSIGLPTTSPATPFWRIIRNVHRADARRTRVRFAVPLPGR